MKSQSYDDQSCSHRQVSDKESISGCALVASLLMTRIQAMEVIISGFNYFTRHLSDLASQHCYIELNFQGAYVVWKQVICALITDGKLAHQEIVKKLVELIGITSIMEVLIRLIGADEHMYVSHVNAMQWIEDTNVLEMIVDKFSSSLSTAPYSAVAELCCEVPGTCFSGCPIATENPAKLQLDECCWSVSEKCTLMMKEPYLGESLKDFALSPSPSVTCMPFVLRLRAINHDSPEVHANAAETLCAITRFAPAGLSVKISSPSFIGRLFRHALEVSRPKSVLVNSLSVCISLLDPKRHTFGAYYTYNRQMTNGSSVIANPETVEGMLESLGDLLNLLDISSAENLLLTTFGKLQPPLGKHRLKIVEFISVLVTVGGEAAERKLIDLGAVQRIINLFFEYPYNNFLHHHVENIITSCLESKNSSLLEHLLHHCDFVGKIIQAEKQFTLEADTNKPTIPAEGKSAPRIGCIGHLTRISNKLVQLGNNNGVIQEHLKGNSDWTDWYLGVLSNRNAVENVYQWACGRPTALHDRNRDSDEDDYQDRDYDVAALANNLSQAFRYGIYNNDEIEEVQYSHFKGPPDVYFDDESAEVVISSLRLGDDHESGSLFTNSNWFAFEEDRDRVANERSTGSPTSPSPDAEEGIVKASGDDVIAGEDEELADTATSSPEAGQKLEHCGTDKPVEWVEWRESSDANDPSDVLPNGEIGNNDSGAADSPSPSSIVTLTKDEQTATDLPSASLNSIETSEPTKTVTENPSSCAPTSADGTEPSTDLLAQAQVTSVFSIAELGMVADKDLNLRKHTKNGKRPKHEGVLKLVLTCPSILYKLLQNQLRKDFLVGLN
ncbi:unnamed protein product [Sphenostylis stenocarpa]|uniref:Uncharacterized protein n=1 Tax=Sphenostylis stenocarpa TaxID=92480 RepID=A0AA86T4R3_9FABA|nr:unnamed protein product [Sphenostylis stenocarpa]